MNSFGRIYTFLFYLTSLILIGSPAYHAIAVPAEVTDEVQSTNPDSLPPGCCSVPCTYAGEASFAGNANTCKNIFTGMLDELDRALTNPTKDCDLSAKSCKLRGDGATCTITRARNNLRQCSIECTGNSSWPTIHDLKVKWPPGTQCTCSLKPLGCFTEGLKKVPDSVPCPELEDRTFNFPSNQLPASQTFPLRKQVNNCQASNPDDAYKLIKGYLQDMEKECTKRLQSVCQGTQLQPGVCGAEAVLEEISKPADGPPKGVCCGSECSKAEAKIR